MAHELVFGDELVRHFQAERMAWGKAGGGRLRRSPTDEGAFPEEPVAPCKLSSRATEKCLEGIK